MPTYVWIFYTKGSHKERGSILNFSAPFFLSCLWLRFFFSMAPVSCNVSGQKSLALCWGPPIAAYVFGEFRARVSSVRIVRFVLGMFAMIGALAFLGCPYGGHPGAGSRYRARPNLASESGGMIE